MRTGVAESAGSRERRPWLERWGGVRIAWCPLAEGLPTPIERLERLERALGLGSLWIKRDDRSSSVYGGNKVRKLEWVLAHARERGARAVVTFGAWGSHHALATAVFAAHCGLACHLVLCPQPVTAHVRETFLASLGAGARIVPIPHFAWLPIGLLRARRAAARAGQGVAYRIPPGGSSVRGVLGYVECGLEIARQIEAGEAPVPRRVFAAAGTLGTVAGLRVGLGLGAARVPGLAETEVVGVRVVPRPVTSARRLRVLTRGALRLLRGAGCANLPEPVRARLLDGQLGEGYGHETPQGRRVADLAAAGEGLELDPTYTAKCVAGIAAEPQRGRNEDVLYVHTLSSAPLEPLVRRGRERFPTLPVGLRRRLAPLGIGEATKEART